MNGHKELAVGLDPLALLIDSSPGSDEVDMRVILYLPSPRMKHGGEPGGCSEPLGVGAQIQQSA